VRKFEDALELEYIDGHDWRVTEDFYYDTDVHIFAGPRIAVPRGFLTDFASVPKILWNLLPPVGRYGKAAVIHDRLYRTPFLASRKAADCVLFEAMGVCNVGWLTKWIIYLGVRIGGHFAYKGRL
jgi:hypothetical protein